MNKIKTPTVRFKISGWGNEIDGYKEADVDDCNKLATLVFDLLDSHNELTQEVIMLRERVSLLTIKKKEEDKDE